MRRLALMLLLTGLGCRPTPDSGRPAPTAPASTRVPAPAPQPAASVTHALVLLEGPSLGDAPVRLHEDGTLTLGAARGTADLLEIDSFWLEQQASVREVDLGEGIAVILLELPTPEQEDPPNRVQVFMPEANALRRVWDWTPSGYGPVPLEVAGDGTLRYTEDGWTACIEAGHPNAAVPLMTVTLALRGEPPMLVEAGREASGKTQACDQLAG